jgi:hypothetical protein
MSEKKKKKQKKKKQQKTDFFGDLKKAGFIIEQQLNQHIQNIVNNDNLINFADEHSNLITNQISSLQRHVETLSTILNLPTKNDVANVAKLTLQTEEKVDKLEEHMIKLTESIQKIMSEDVKSKDDVSNDE